MVLEVNTRVLCIASSKSVYLEEKKKTPVAIAGIKNPKEFLHFITDAKNTIVKDAIAAMLTFAKSAIRVLIVLVEICQMQKEGF